MKKISIIIPTKNEAEYLPRLLESIRQQTISVGDIVVADFNSSDETLKIAGEYGCKTIVGGLPAVGRNSGAKIAGGEIYYFIDADTCLPKNFIKNTVHEFEIRCLEVATVNNWPIYCEGERGMGSKTIKFFDRLVYDIHNFALRFFENIKYPIATGTCIIITRELFEEIGGFDEAVYQYHDSNLVLRASKKGKFGVLNSEKIFISTRRFDRENRLIFSLKQGIIGTARRIIFGEIRNKNEYFK